MATNNSINNSSLTTKYTGGATWTKNARTKVVKVIGWAGGHGGGSHIGTGIDPRLVPW